MTSILQDGYKAIGRGGPGVCATLVRDGAIHMVIYVNRMNTLRSPPIPVPPGVVVAFAPEVPAALLENGDMLIWSHANRRWDVAASTHPEKAGRGEGKIR